MKTFSQILTTAALSLGLTHAVNGAITGQWSFEKADLFLSAKIGLPIEAIDFDTDAATEFGTTSQGAFASVPNIGGVPVKVMKFPKTTPAGGYYVPTGANPNGGGVFINQYTIIMDVLYPSSSSSKRRALFQTDEGGSPNAEFFVNGSDQIGTDGGAFGGALTPDTWHRVVISADLSASPPIIDRYIDGTKVSSGNPGGGLDGRFAIISLWFDADDDDESEAGYMSSLQFRDEKVDDALVTVLGGATPEGIFSQPPNPYVRVLTPSPSTAIFPARSTVSPTPLIQAVIEDGATSLDTMTVTLSLDGGAVTPVAVDKVDTTTTISYTVPTVLGSLSKHTVRVNYKDSNGDSLQVQWDFVVGQYNGLPADAAGAIGSANTPGLIVRSAQAPVGVGFLNRNTLGRAIRQLNGTLTDTDGVLVENVALPGPNVDGSTDVDLVNYHVPFGTYAFFPDDLDFSGIPGAEGSRDNFADDAIAYLELSAGVHRIGVSVATTRTDVNDDDGFTLFTGTDPRNILAPVVGSFDRGSVPAFSDSFTMNEFTVIAPLAGVYPFRLVHWQGGSQASLEFYTVDLETGDRILVNDANDSRAVIAYRYSTAPFANRPYLAEVSPRPGAQGISSEVPIEALIIDDQTAVDARPGVSPDA